MPKTFLTPLLLQISRIQDSCYERKWMSQASRSWQRPRQRIHRIESSSNLVITLRLQGIVDGQHNLRVVETIFGRQSARP